MKPAPPARSVPEDRIAAVRAFNRFYTQRIGVLREHLLDSPFALTPARVLYELAQWRPEAAAPTATALATALGLDPGYLSRILRGFEERGLVRKTVSDTDGRQRSLSLTPAGRRAFAPLDARSRAEVRALLAPMPEADRNRLVEAMHSVAALLGEDLPEARRSDSYLLRSPRPGDLGWIIHRHGTLYAREYGYDAQFEALVAEIAARFVQHLDAKRERCWIAERNGEIVGSVFLVSSSKTVAKLRLLLVEPHARGLGIGARLIEECIGFAREAGYRSLVLWTQSELHAARRLYRRAGFHRTRSERHESFGKKLVAETWELTL